ncbi:hypothetical protein ACFOZ5_18335 [Marinobacter lacisalsi]|uniref:Uncharacterized protein n=1 Tax=Marinobacter lacisalsi TaxID=475979 RepID=A0ABV8QNK5_9GAMM
MADVHINEVTSRLSLADADALLSPEVLARITQAVREQLENEQQRERQRQDEREIRSRSFPLER